MLCEYCAHNVFRLCYNSKHGIIGRSPPCENLHITFVVRNDMANITINHMTPRHFFEAVTLLKLNAHNISITEQSISIHFEKDPNETKEDTEKRSDRLLHFMYFVQELVDSEVPIDLEEFVRKYKKPVGYGFYKRRRK